MTVLKIMRFISNLLIALPAAITSYLFSAVPAHADLKLCNRMSYVVEAAIGIDDKSATATRGWFRIDPAACRVVVQGTLTADRILFNARALGVYGSSPVPQSGGDTLCIAPDNFVIAAARQCRAGQTPAPFTQVHPTQGDDGHLVAYLAEGSEYDDEQARLAGIQRLLVIAGYDAAPIDGVDGPKTQAALAAFLKNRGLTADIVQSPNFFTTMIDAVQSPSSTGLTWCNDTPHKIMAAVGHRRRQDRDQPRLVSHRSRQMPASRRGRAAQADFQFRRGGRCRQPRHEGQGQAAELGRHHPALHARDQIRNQRTRRLRHPRPRRDRLCRGRHVGRRQDAAVCDAVMKTPRAFTDIDTWVFDLDNTLYPHHVNLWQQVDARIGEFVSAYLKISPDEARVLQKDYYRRYGTSMRGMMTEHGVHADDYLAYVHKIDHSPLQPNPAMGAAIAKLPGRKLILTNGSTDHAGAVLKRLGIGEHFEAVFDIIAAELEPKPAPQTYQKFLRDHGVNPKASAMFEDLSRNLVVPHQLGMTTVLVVPDGTQEVVREDWELEGRDAAYVDHVTDDLTGFLQKVGGGT